MWEVIAFTCLGWSLGLLMGLSLGFRVGTRRAILLFTRHFPTALQLNVLISLLLKSTNKPEEKK